MFGKSKIDIEDWKVYTIYENRKSVKSKVVDWFWESISELSNDQIRKFLIYTTGCGSLPAGGFGSLVNNRNE